MYMDSNDADDELSAQAPENNVASDARHRSYVSLWLGACVTILMIYTTRELSTYVLAALFAVLIGTAMVFQYELSDTTRQNGRTENMFHHVEETEDPMFNIEHMYNDTVMEITPSPENHWLSSRFAEEIMQRSLSASDKRDSADDEPTDAGRYHHVMAAAKVSTDDKSDTDDLPDHSLSPGNDESDSYRCSLHGTFVGKKAMRQGSSRGATQCIPRDPSERKFIVQTKEHGPSWRFLVGKTGELMLQSRINDHDTYRNTLSFGQDMQISRAENYRTRSRYAKTGAASGGTSP